MKLGFQSALRLALVGFAAGITFFVWTVVTSANLNRCIVCKRTVPAETRTLAETDGARALVCCPACALRLGARSESGVVIERVTDHATGGMIDARSAYVVVGGGVNYCTRQPLPAARMGRRGAEADDPCDPGMVSFADLEDARAFQRAHGGRLLPADLAFDYRPAR